MDDLNKQYIQKLEHNVELTKKAFGGVGGI